MIGTSTKKKKPAKTSTASKRPANRRYALSSREGGNNPGLSSAPGPASESSTLEFPPRKPSDPQFSTFLTKLRSSEKDAEQPSQSKSTLPQIHMPVAASAPTIGQVANVAAQMGQMLEGNASPTSPPNSATPGGNTSTKPRVLKVDPETLGESMGIGMLAAAMGAAAGVAVDPLVIRQLLETMIDATGVSGDPLGMILVEQILLMRVVSGNLHALTLLGTTGAERSVVSSSAVSVSAELRRMVLALHAYRVSAGLPVSKPGSTAVKPSAGAAALDETERKAS